MGKYDQFHSKWIEKYQSGIACPEISKEYGCTIKTVQLVIRNAGISRTNREAQTLLSNYRVFYDEWIEKYKEGMSSLDIANQYGCNSGIVGAVVRRAGISRSNSESQYLRDTKYGQFHQEWINKYISGVSSGKIAEEYGCSVPTVLEVINGAGIIRSLSDSALLADSKYKQFYPEWIEKYVDGMSFREIGSEYGCDGMTVGTVVRKVGKSRSISDIMNIRYGKYDNYFDNIDDEEKSYFLGMLLADGCIRIHKTGHQQVMSLSLKLCDGYIVERLASILGRKVYYSPLRGRTTEQACIHVHSDHICNTLRGYGFTERKSLDNHEAIGFNHIPPELMRHFIRGIIDGDGCFNITKDKRYKNSITGHVGVCGNINDMQSIANIFTGIGCRNAIVRHRGNILYRIDYGSKSDVTRILHYLYGSATIYLERKKVKAADILALYRSGV